MTSHIFLTKMPAKMFIRLAVCLFAFALIVSGCAPNKPDDAAAGCSSDNTSYELFVYDQAGYHFSFLKSQRFRLLDIPRPMGLVDITFRRPYDFNFEKDAPLYVKDGTDIQLEAFPVYDDNIQYTSTQLTAVRSSLERFEGFAVEDESDTTVADVKTKQWTFAYELPDYTSGTIFTLKYIVFKQSGFIWEMSLYAMRDELSESDLENWECVLKTFQILD